MPTITWDEVGTREYESGIDRCVLYVDNVGVAWSGVTAFDEKPSGGDITSFYLDAVKFAQLAGYTDFEATLESFSAPIEFGPCEGTIQVYNGLFATEQPKKPFGLSYRTKIGNDLEGLEHGYKLHLVYNALAAPSERDNASVSGSADAIKLSWDIFTVPLLGAPGKPTSHYIVDSRYTEPTVLSNLEDILYGKDLDIPQLPDWETLSGLFE